ncbi:hypothetical protein LU11_gp391 [Pseudomonas phage Lu11]|uniref:hypothetical protein n=1 Tax=Pseudomonas phage Lu11 TaxID=1161927 RepID=UPI00025F18E4|nr:hypothetical protein LU11_gp391 [Pseudomonas phage Lu11]AFH14922.1 hypothetical protein Lu11_0384 [Pseudomonas phage Lu11]
MKRIYNVKFTATFTSNETNAAVNKTVSFPVSAESAEEAIAKTNTAERARMVIATVIPQQHQHKVTCTLSNFTAE